MNDVGRHAILPGLLIYCGDTSNKWAVVYEPNDRYDSSNWDVDSNAKVIVLPSLRVTNWRLNRLWIKISGDPGFPEIIPESIEKSYIDALKIIGLV